MLGNAVYIEEESRRRESHTNRYLSKNPKNGGNWEKNENIYVCLFKKEKFCSRSYEVKENIMKTKYKKFNIYSGAHIQTHTHRVTGLTNFLFSHFISMCICLIFPFWSSWIPETRLIDK